MLKSNHFMILESKKVPSKCKHARNTPIVGEPKPGPLLTAISHAAPQAQCDVTWIVSSQGVSGLNRGLGACWKKYRFQIPILKKSCGLILQDLFYSPIARMCNSPMFSFRCPFWIGALVFKCVVSVPAAAIPHWSLMIWVLPQNWTNTFLGIGCVTLVM